MLKQFINSYRDSCDCFELMVLADNEAAVKLYQSAGFEMIKELNGFSVDDRELPCLLMRLQIQ